MINGRLFLLLSLFLAFGQVSSAQTVDTIKPFEVCDIITIMNKDCHLLPKEQLEYELAIVNIVKDMQTLFPHWEWDTVSWHYALRDLFYVESLEKPKAVSSSKAYGIFQAMPLTRAGIGMPQGLSRAKQVPYFVKYLKWTISQNRINVKNITSILDIYLLIHWPAASQSANSNFVLYRKGSSAYQHNSGLDLNNDGIVTRNDVDNWLIKILYKGLKIPYYIETFAIDSTSYGSWR